MIIYRRRIRPISFSIDPPITTAARILDPVKPIIIAPIELEVSSIAY